LIIREGSLTLVVEDARQAREAAEEMAAALEAGGAFVVSSTEWGATDGRQPDVVMELRIPAARFDEVMDRLAALALEVRERRESAQDVTEEYVDAHAHLQSLEAARNRLLEILQTAETTEAVLQAEQQLTQREAEIGSLKGRLQYLSQSAQLAKVHLTLQAYTLRQPLEGRWRPGETARDALEALVMSVQSLGSFLIYFSIAVLPWLTVLGLLVFGIARLRKRRGDANPAQK
jgi:hypothetical protein